MSSASFSYSFNPLSPRRGRAPLATLTAWLEATSRILASLARWPARTLCTFRVQRRLDCTPPPSRLVCLHAALAPPYHASHRPHYVERRLNTRRKSTQQRSQSNASWSQRRGRSQRTEAA